jgi:hypothetical protein
VRGRKERDEQNDSGARDAVNARAPDSQQQHRKGVEYDTTTDATQRDGLDAPAA